MMNLLEASTTTAQKPAENKREAVTRRSAVVVVEEYDGLLPHVAAWDDLAPHAAEPNPFYESWMVLPALRHLEKARPFSFVFVYEDEPATTAPLSPRGRGVGGEGASAEEFRPLTPGPSPPRGEGETKLCGFFPFQRSRYKRLPVSVLTLWTHAHCFLRTPLLRSGTAKETLNALFDWARNDPLGAPVLDFDEISGDGAFNRFFTDVLYERKTTCYLKEGWTRAFWRARESADSYLSEALSSGGRQDFRRKRKRLGELGKLESRTLTSATELDTWLHEFIDLEGSGWKGESRTALAAAPQQREFFLEIGRAAFARGQLQMLGLFLDNKPIALKCNFRAGDAAFFYKPAYDESHARFSPGALVELDHIHLCHQEPAVRWMDYCTAPDNVLANRICLERRPIHSWMLSSGRAPGDFLVSSRPLLRWLARKLKRTRS